MQTFAYVRASTLSDATDGAAQADTMVIAGGTELLNWMKDGIVAPVRLLDINGLSGLDQIDADDRGLRIGALARMSDVAEHEAVRRDYPAIAEALLKTASPQLRNMASMGGNLMQRTRCPYFRAEVELPCNKRRPGSGCSALEGADRSMALFGWSESCLATHPSDVAVAFAALDATVHVQGRGGTRTIPFETFYRLPGDSPDRETTLDPGELITMIEVPASPTARRSHYLKVSERASFASALVSAAVGLEMDGPTIREVRIALGGVAHKPWRLGVAEQSLRGASLVDTAALRRALDGAFAEARPRRHNGFKIELAKRTILRTLQIAGEMV
jgi:xanthine dehydrogenase YagS FAD-binding subunit